MKSIIFLLCLLGIYHVFAGEKSLQASLDFTCSVYSTSFSGELEIENSALEGNILCQRFPYEETICLQFSKKDIDGEVTLNILRGSALESIASFNSLKEGDIFEKILWNQQSRTIPLKCSFENVRLNNLDYPADE